MAMTVLQRSGWFLAAFMLAVGVNARQPDSPGATLLAQSTISIQPPGTKQPIPASLAGQVFQWQYSLKEDGTRVQPASPERYQLRFSSEGRISLKADCNHYAASVRLTGSVFTSGPMIGTRALCPKGSLERPYINFIESASQWSLDGSQLTLRRPHDGGLIVFVAITGGE